MEEADWDDSVKRVAQQVKHYLITMLGKTAKEASDEEFYRCLAWVLREEVMINWTATAHTHRMRKAKRVYYLSLEWLPGRMMVNNMTNIASWDLVQKVIKYMSRDLRGILKVEQEPGLGNGGLGRLAACFLDSLATHHYPAMGYGLRYQYGIFRQRTYCGAQVEGPDPWLIYEYPWEKRQDAFSQFAQFSGHTVVKKNKHNEDSHILVDYEEVRALAYDVPIVGYGGKNDFSALTLRLFSTKESPKNFLLARFNAGDLSDATKNTSVTDVLYPNDKNSLGLTMRIKQEYLLVTSALKDIFRQYFLMYDNLDEFANTIRIQINDTHPALLIAELMRLLTQEYELKWDQSWDIVNTVCSYTNHTVLRESLEAWDVHMIKELLPRQYYIIERINQDFCNRVRAKYPGDEEKVRKMSIIQDGRVHMAHLAIIGSHRVNGVARLHSKILKESIFPEFDQFFPDRIINVTNGVTPRRWLNMCNPELALMLNELIGKEWVTDLSQLEKLHDFAGVPKIQERFLKIKLDNKKRLLEFLCNEKREKYQDTVDLTKEFFLSCDTIFDVLVKRIHEYKRQLMKALFAIMVMQDLDKNPDSHKVKRTIIIGGKAAPGYEMAKNIIRLFYILGRKINRDPKIGDKLKVIFIENYNVSKAELIIPATDLSNQISTAGQEASGTSNMKFAMNGALTIGTDDGANVEMREAVTNEHWPFLFGCSSEDIMKMTRDKSYNSQDVVNQDPQIKEALETLINGSLADNEVEEEVLRAIYNSLMVGVDKDRYFVLKDLRSYYNTQMKVEELYLKPNEWAKMALHNIASMGRFSSDESIKNYAENIWGLPRCPVDSEELKRVKREFLEADRCYIA